MRADSIAAAAICIFVAGCSSELAERPAASDPGQATAAEAPFRAPPAYEPDPLLSPVPPQGSEPPPTGHEQLHSPTSAPPGNPPLREEPGAHAHPPHGDK